MAQKKRNIKLTQKDGYIKTYVNGEMEYSLDANFIVNNIKNSKTDAISLANIIAELMHDCLNCRTASCKLEDLNGMGSYIGTYFEYFDYRTENDL